LTLAHNAAALGLNVDTTRLFGEPYGDYHLAVGMVCDQLRETTRQAEIQAQARMRKGV
jgi:hypothetical protein